MYYKACRNYFPVLLCTTELAQSTSQYYFVLQTLHKALPSTTAYYKACTKHFPVYCVLQSLQKLLPRTTLYYKACTNYFPVLLCTTKLAQSLHKALPRSYQYYFPQKFCSFPHRHGDVSAAKRTRFCSFPHRHGDARGQAETRDETEVLQLPPKTRRRERRKKNERGFAASPIDTAMPEDKQRLKLCSFPHRHGDVSAAKRTIHYYFVLQSLHKQVPVLLCTTKLAQSRSQYYCVLQSLHKLLPSTTLYYKLAETTCFPQRHGDVSAAKQTRFCSFPHRHGDARGQAETEVLQLPP